MGGGGGGAEPSCFVQTANQLAAFTSSKAPHPFGGSSSAVHQLFSPGSLRCSRLEEARGGGMLPGVNGNKKSNTPKEKGREPPTSPNKWYFFGFKILKTFRWLSKIISRAQARFIFAYANPKKYWFIPVFFVRMSCWRKPILFKPC